MRKPKQILDKRLEAFSIIFDEKIPDKSIPFIIGAMKQYAEEYHRAELLKLNKSDVISSLSESEECKCIRFVGGDKYYPNGCEIHPNG
jgi:hypothetical protein